MAFNLTEQIEGVFDDYTRDMKRTVNNAVDTVAKEGVSRLRSISPRKSGDYAKGWAIKRERGRSGINDVTIHNKTDYQLTHLLENGHLIVNGKGTYGRTRGIKHIAPVEQYFNTEVVEEIERELST